MGIEPTTSGLFYLMLAHFLSMYLHWRQRSYLCGLRITAHQSKPIKHRVNPMKCLAPVHNKWTCQLDLQTYPLVLNDKQESCFHHMACFHFNFCISFLIFVISNLRRTHHPIAYVYLLGGRFKARLGLWLKGPPYYVVKHLLRTFLNLLWTNWTPLRGSLGFNPVCDPLSAIAY